MFHCVPAGCLYCHAPLAAEADAADVHLSFHAAPVAADVVLAADQHRHAAAGGEEAAAAPAGPAPVAPAAQLAAGPGRSRPDLVPAEAGRRVGAVAAPARPARPPPECGSRGSPAPARRPAAG